ncbi:DUF2520 domain-containing protein [Pontibacter sp. KCTC 32443]|uniref:Rossmann-like and DUF2520 domain-containing protein n=1 Tax=Pontibacter TaxID=323449 RepID=UPI00164E4621|nr:MULTISPECIES: Rossmann-like and DUF2520 domain-containing protein [Pontibacter]MBC5774221.1 DUF2520 domain-containing protein [Pontibacter sp. KCTC 32443]
MNIAIVGAGNVAWHLSFALQQAGHSIKVVYSRTMAHGEELASQLKGTTAVTSLDFSSTPMQVILIAVPDAALTEVAASLKVQPGTIVAHTSGSQPITTLVSIPGAKPAVFYPLQTFTKNAPVNMQEVPILIEADTKETTALLEQLAKSISQQVELVNSDKRKQLHLAAVFACNFTNHLLGISQELLQNADLPANLLQPLIHETIKKASAHHPFTVQTGPAVRHDQNVVEEHLRLLQPFPQLQSIYQQLTQSIQAAKANPDSLGKYQ